MQLIQITFPANFTKSIVTSINASYPNLTLYQQDVAIIVNGAETIQKMLFIPNIFRQIDLNTIISLVKAIAPTQSTFNSWRANATTALI